jgi:transposase
METITMSLKETRYAEVIPQVLKGHITQEMASLLLKLGLRQVKRLCKRYRANGTTGLLHKGRGKPSNRAIPENLRKEVLNVIRKFYPDFGPQLIHELLYERHSITVSAEWVRKLMIKEELWLVNKRKIFRVHLRRKRRSQYGELEQADGSYHNWFEDRGPKCCLLVIIDDATSEIGELRFVENESTEGYMEIFRSYIKRRGRPLAFYTDRLNAVNSTKSQVQRALGELDIELINANSPQAKGRVERANSTLQDRLIKKMRLEGISSIEEGNRYLEKYREEHNRRFARKPLDPKNAHRTIGENIKLEKIFCIKEERKVGKDHSVHYRHKEYILQNGVNLRGKAATVFETEGTVHIEVDGKEYEYMIYEEQPFVQDSMSRREVDSHLDRRRYMTVIQRHRRGIGCLR